MGTCAPSVVAVFTHKGCHAFGVATVSFIITIGSWLLIRPWRRCFCMLNARKSIQDFSLPLREAADVLLHCRLVCFQSGEVTLRLLVMHTASHPLVEVDLSNRFSCTGRS